MWIEKSLMNVDIEYQRESVLARTLKIARDWSWTRCGALIIVERDDGRYFILDGQHRALAASKRDDINELPCLVFQSSGVEKEALVFRDINTDRRLPTALETWKAEVKGEDENTLFAHALITRSGLKPGKSGEKGTIRCVKSIKSAAQFNREALVKIWPLVVKIYQESPVHKMVFEGLIYIESHLPEGASLTQQKWKDRVLQLGDSGLLGAVHKASQFYAKRGPRTYAFGILEAINKGRQIKLAMDGMNS
jgi:hypothetical protein